MKNMQKEIESILGSISNKFAFRKARDVNISEMPCYYVEMPSHTVLFIYYFKEKVSSLVIDKVGDSTVLQGKPIDVSKLPKELNKINKKLEAFGRCESCLSPKIFELSSFCQTCGVEETMRLPKDPIWLNAIPKYPETRISEICDYLANTYYSKVPRKKCWDLIKENIEYEATLSWILSRYCENDDLLEKSNSYFKISSSMENFNYAQIDKFFAYLFQSGKGAMNLDHLLGIISSSEKYDPTLRTPDPEPIETEKAVPLGLKEEEPLALASQFSYMDFPFKYFNPMQTMALPYVKKDCNMVISALTASGKTVVAEMVIAHTLKHLKKSSIYLAPMKALAEEKISDFKEDDHLFSKYNLSIMTGDYSMTSSLSKELSDANIIVMTNEMLATRSRLQSSEKNLWLYKVGAVIVDEAHLLHVDGRGDSTEAALMSFTKLNPKARIILLSATMPNCNELARWVQVLNRKETALIESDYRPCKLIPHYVKIDYRPTYQERQRERMDQITNILREIGF